MPTRNHTAARSMASAQRERRTERVIEGDTIELTYDQSEKQFGALSELSGRALAGPESEDKVFDLLMWYDGAHEKFVKLRNKAIIDVPTPKDVDDADLPAHIKEARTKKVQAILDTKHVMRRVPTRMILTAADMPRRDIKGEIGMANKTGVSSIKYRLGALFERGATEQAEDPHRDVGGEEE